MIKKIVSFILLVSVFAGVFLITCYATPPLNPVQMSLQCKRIYKSEEEIELVIGLKFHEEYGYNIGELKHELKLFLKSEERIIYEKEFEDFLENDIYWHTNSDDSKTGIKYFETVVLDKNDFSISRSGSIYIDVTVTASGEDIEEWDFYGSNNITLYYAVKEDKISFSTKSIKDAERFSKKITNEISEKVPKDYVLPVFIFYMGLYVFIIIIGLFLLILIVILIGKIYKKIKTRTSNKRRE